MTAGHLRGLRATLLVGVAAATMVLASPLVSRDWTTARAQPAALSQFDFREALEPFGRWISHRRWGEVWQPDMSQRDWRPYQAGNWIYTDEWGWYWNADDEEDDWGWITYHYGRWTYDRSLGWVWIPGEEWAPAWVDWRRGNDVVGWAPLPPDDVLIADDPFVWSFVALRDLTAPRISRVFLPPQRHSFYFRNSVTVNRTFGVQGRRFAINPGIPPAFVARAAGKPVRAFEVRPRVIAGTVKIGGAVEVNPRDLRRDGQRRGPARAAITETSAEIRPIDKIPAPQALGRNEKGRFGERPPRAALQNGAPPSLPSRARPGVTPPPAVAPDRKDQPSPGVGVRPPREQRGVPLQPGTPVGRPSREPRSAPLQPGTPLGGQSVQPGTPVAPPPAARQRPAPGPSLRGRDSSPRGAAHPVPPQPPAVRNAPSPVQPAAPNAVNPAAPAPPAAAVNPRPPRGGARAPAPAPAGKVLEPGTPIPR
jgi:hypothetical protein